MNLQSLNSNDLHDRYFRELHCQPSYDCLLLISNIVLEKKNEVSFAVLYVAFPCCGQMRKCFMDTYDGSKASHHGNEVMLLKSP